MNRVGRFGQALKAAALIVCVAAAVAFAWRYATARPVDQRYPDRKPVRFWHMWSAEWKEVVDRIVARFNESQTEYEVIALSIPGASANMKFLMGAAGGDPPDLMAQWNPVIPVWAQNGLLLPLDSLMTPEEYAGFKKTAYPAAQKIGTFRGHLYGVTIGINMFALYYLPERLREEGLDPARFPRTLEELSEWGDRLNRFDEKGNLTRIGFMPSMGFFSWVGYAPLFGGGCYDWTGEKVTLNTPENLRALQYLADRRHKLGFDNVLRFESGFTTQYGSGLAWPFIQEAYSITLDGQWRVEQLARYAPELNYDTAPLPAPRGGKPQGGITNGNFMVIPRAAKNIAGAWAFTRFWSGLDNPERAAEFYSWGGWLPINRAVAEAPAYQEYLRKYPQFRTFVDLMESDNITPMPPVPYQDYIQQRVSLTEDQAMRGTLTPQEALEKLEREVEREVQRRKQLGYRD